MFSFLISQLTTQSGVASLVVRVTEWGFRGGFEIVRGISVIERMVWLHDIKIYRY